MSSSYQVQLPVFEGPLDLLLQLVEREELDITTIALARVTDQYLAHLAELERRQAGDLSAFLVVAAKLILIKSQALLPSPPQLTPEDEDVGNELVEQLRAYKRFKQVAALLRQREEEGLYAYVRTVPLPPLEPQFDLGGASLDDLLELVREALDAVPASPVEEVVKSVTVTIEEQMTSLTRRLAHRPRIHFREVLSEASSRVEVIVTLLAVLELIKRDHVRVRQEQMFGEIVIERLEEEPAPADAPATSPAV